MALRGKQGVFVLEYIKDFNGTQAYIRAGYKVKNEATAAVNAHNLLRNPNIQSAIAEAKKERIDSLKVDANYVLLRLVEIDQMDVLDIMDDEFNFKPIGEWPKIWRQYISGLDNSEQFEGFGEDRTQTGWLKKIKWPDKVKNLELLGKHISIGAFKEKLELGNDPENPLTDTKSASKKLAALAKLKKAKDKTNG